MREEYQIKERDKSEVIADSLTFDGLAIDILNAGNDIARVKDELYNKIKDSTNSFAKLLTKTISISKQKEDIKLASILKALEFHPLTIRDLAYSLNISIDESRLLVKRLWDQGKINTLESNILGNIFPFFRKKVAVSKLDETRTHFTLTSVGHFQLHPVIKY